MHVTSEEVEREQEDSTLERAEETPSRRRFFAVGASLATATMAVAPALGAQQPTKRSALRDMVRRLMSQPPDPGFDPFGKGSAATTKGWDSTLARLVRRVTNGVTEDEMQLAQKLGFYGYLNYHLAPSKIDDSAVSTFVSTNYPLLGQDVETIYNLDQRLVGDQLIESNLYRAAFSKRQLYERMVEFWADHFNIALTKVQYLLLVDNREVIRKHALGKFPDMLKASAHSPAMLEYLDNTRNRRTTLNENYAREIMELHSLGVDGGYSQTDVRELARCLTGWTLTGRGRFNFDPAGHDFGQKVVLGTTIAAMPSTSGAAGKGDADTMIDILCKHPSTARYIAKKMLRWLLQYEPSQAQIASVAAAYTRTSGDITTMVRTILTPGNLNAAGPKLKRPYTFMLSALRATRPSVTKVAALADRQLLNLGQPMFGWEPPDGYPDRADYWAGGILQRWNFASFLSTANNSEMQFDIARFVTTPTADGVTEMISKEFFGGLMPDRLKSQLKSYIGDAAVTQARAREAVALALSSSTFQWL